MTRHRVCTLDELPELECRVFELGDWDVAVARAGDRVFALEDRCSHDDGEFDGGVITCAGDDAKVEIECPRHGARFDMSSGSPTRMPAVAPVEAFEASVEDGVIWVEIPDDL